MQKPSKVINISLCLEQKQLIVKAEKRNVLKKEHQNRFDLENICGKNNKQKTLFIVFSQ